MREGRFRSDLLFRIGGMFLTAPALRERKSDIGLLAKWMTLRHSAKLRADRKRCMVEGISAEAIAKLVKYGWPGNVRELDTVIHRALVWAETPWIEADDLLLPEATDDVLEPAPAPASRPQDAMSYRQAKAEFERAYLRSLLDSTDGNITRAAALAGLSRSRLNEMLSKYGLRGGDR